MALFAKIISHPPLAQVTVIPTNRKEINFTVAIESSQSFPNQPWETSIWYDHSGYSGTKSQWKALDLQKIDSEPTVLSDGSMSNVFRHVFFGSLPSVFTDNNKNYKGRKVSFTIRYRTNNESPWQWANTQFGTPDGTFIIQPPIDPNFLSASPVELTSGWTTRKLTSEAPEARLYSIESSHPIPISDKDNAKFESKVLGRVTLSTRFFALVRIWSPWLAPRHGESRFNIAEDALFCSFLRADGLHVVLLAVNGIDDILTLFKSNEVGDVVVTARNDSGKDGKFRILVATSWNFEIANCAVMYEMRKMVRSSAACKDAIERFPASIRTESVDSDTVLVSNSEAGGKEDAPPGPQWLQDWYDGLAYCTWNSIGQDLNADKIMGGLESLSKHGIKVSTLIIDDNWQSLDGAQGETSQFQRGMTRFEGNKAGFPEGMKAFTTKIREKYPHIHDIAVWHALLGYWGGISPNGEIAKEYKTVEVRKSKGVAEGTMLAIHPVDIYRFYDDFYTFLFSSGVTSVKTDAQFMLDLLDSTPDRRAMIIPYQSAWTQAHLRQLSGKAISCMSQIPQILFHSFLSTNTPRIMLRNSDDFFPDIPASHPWHVFCNAHNALLVQHLNVLPDWDMFQTTHPYSGFHAAARCVSGGPIYITDTPGQHDIDLIAQMTARSPRGATVILRPSNFGKSRSVYDNYTEGHALKIGVYDGKSEVGTGILGVFNVSDHEITFMLPLADFPGVENQEHESGAKRQWIIRSHFSKRMTSPITPSLPITPNQLVQTTLDVRGYDIWSALPVHNVSFASSSVDIAVVGLLGKMTGACAIIESTFNVMDGSKRLKVHVQLKALGRLGLWVSGLAGKKVEDLMVVMQQKVVPAERVSIEPVLNSDSEKNRIQAAMLEIDVEAAWNDLGLDAGWGNEVGVEVFLSEMV